MNPVAASSHRDCALPAVLSSRPRSRPLQSPPNGTTRGSGPGVIQPRSTRQQLAREQQVTCVKNDDTASCRPQGQLPRAWRPCCKRPKLEMFSTRL